MRRPVQAVGERLVRQDLADRALLIEEDAVLGDEDAKRGELRPAFACGFGEARGFLLRRGDVAGQVGVEPRLVEGQRGPLHHFERLRVRDDADVGNDLGVDLGAVPVIPVPVPADDVSYRPVGERADLGQHGGGRGK
jgi:hypothetical protein